jgi:hypothetical protein
MRYFFLILPLFFCSCSVRWACKTCLNSGSAPDTVWRTKVDTLMSPADTVKVIEERTITDVDTVLLKEECKDPVRNFKKIQERVCPELDTTLNVVMSYRDSTFMWPIFLKSKGGKFSAQVPPIILPIVREEGRTDFIVGYTGWRLALLCGLSGIVGMILLIIAWFLIRAKRSG